MKKLLILVLILSTFLYRSVAQENCAFDFLRKEMIKKDPEFKIKEDNLNRLVIDYLQKNQERIKTQFRTGSVLFTIPIVVHVMHTGGAIGTIYNPSDAQIIGTIDYLNQVYKGTYAGGYGAGDIQIQFALAKRTPNCANTNGIDRVNASSLPGYISSGVTGETTVGCPEVTLKDFARWDTNDYFNIWVVNKIDGNDGSNPGAIGGYAYQPTTNNEQKDGVVILASQMKANLNVITHEIGHALNLYHPFEGGENDCPANSDCNTQGDRVCDTEPIKKFSALTAPICRLNFNNPCTNLNYTINTQWNIMNYTSCKHLFTADQKVRMLASMSVYPTRATLVRPANQALISCSTDLIIQNASVSPQNINPGSQGTAIFNVRNNGSAVSGASFTALWLTKDQKFDGSPTDINLNADVSVPPLFNYQTSNQFSKQFTIPPATATGTWYIMFGADATDLVNEGDETNNQTFIPITIGAACTISTPSPLSPGTPSYTGYTISNNVPFFNWTIISGATTYKINISKEPYGASNIIHSANCINPPYQIPAGILQNGINYRWDVIAYSSCNSSCQSWISANSYFTAPSINKPDLIITNNSISSNSTLAGSTVNVFCSEKNQGNNNATSNTVGLYLSKDVAFTPGANGDFLIGNISVPSILSGNVSATQSTSIQIPLNTPPGTYYIIFWADDGNVVDESDELNNSQTSLINITGSSQTYNITTTSNPVAGGTTVGSGSYSAGQNATVTAASNSGYTFVNWTENSILYTSTPSYTFNVTGNRSLVANFTTCTYTLNTYSHNMYSPAASQSFWVYTKSDCSWNATTSSCDWLTLTNSSGTGNGLVTFNMTANSGSSARSCNIFVGGQTYTITQSGYVAPCATAPSIPLNISTAIVGNNETYIGWQGSSVNVTNFEVERSLTSNGPFVLIASTGKTFSYVDKTGIPGVNYCYRVRACCEGNCSPYTSVSCITACSFSTAPTGVIASAESICLGDSIILSAQGGSAGTGATWTWRFNQCYSGSIVGYGQTITVKPTVSGYYVVKPETGNCQITLTCAIKYITVNPLPTPSLISESGATTFCSGGSVTLSGNVNGIWNNGLTTSSINVNSSGDYYVNNSNTCGITTSNHILVTVNSKPNQPGNIIGNPLVNVGQSTFYKISSVNNASKYNWTLTGGGNIASGQGNDSININWLNQGSYILTVNAENDCGISNTVSLPITVSFATAINNLDNNFKLKINPNPSSGQFIVNIKESIAKSISFEVINVVGQLVYSNQQKVRSNDFSQNVDLRSVPNGIYLLQIRIDDKVYWKKLVKQ